MKKHIICLVLLAFALAACSRVRTTATIFHGDNHEMRGTISVARIDDADGDELEFQLIGKYVLEKLVSHGYKTANSGEKPDFTAYLKYETSKAQKIGKVSDSGISLDIKNHIRTVSIDIYQNIPGNKPSKKYEMKAISEGKCGSINPKIVMHMIDALFKDFPGTNGQTNIRTENFDDGSGRKLIQSC